MKTPEEIKKGLETCSTSDILACGRCPYGRDDADLNECIKNLCADALAYIQQLEERQGRDDV